MWDIIPHCPTLPWCWNPNSIYVVRCTLGIPIPSLSLPRAMSWVTDEMRKPRHLATCTAFGSPLSRNSTLMLWVPSSPQCIQSCRDYRSILLPQPHSLAVAGLIAQAGPDTLLYLKLEHHTVNQLYSNNVFLKKKSIISTGLSRIWSPFNTDRTGLSLPISRNPDFPPDR